MKLFGILPVHITRIGLILVGYWSLETPAKSAPVYEHQLQQKLIIKGWNSSFIIILLRQH